MASMRISGMDRQGWLAVLVSRFCNFIKKGKRKVS